LHIKRMLLLNQTSCEIPLETSHNNSLWQASYCTTNHPVSNLRQGVWSILLNIADAQLGLKEDQPCHLATRCCGNLGASCVCGLIGVQLLVSFSFQTVKSSKIFIIHSTQSSASEMKDTALGLLFHFFFPEIIFGAEILTVHFIDLIP
jgi:hypothetical protein